MAFKNLILFAGAYPFRDLNTYLNTEIQYLASHFEKIYVLTNSKEIPKISLPENVELHGLTVSLSQSEKWSGLTAIIQPEVLSELKTFYMNLNAYKSIFNHYNAAEKFVDRLQSFLQEKNIKIIDTLFYCYWTDYRSIALCLLKKKNAQLKFITRMHGWDLYWERHSEGYLPFRKLLFDETDNIFFISEHGKEYFKKKLKIRVNDKLKLSYLGVRDNGLNPEDNTPGKLSVISCSFSVLLKRINLIAEALAEIDDIQVEWKHIGDGPSQSFFQEATHRALKGKANVKYQFLGELSQQSVLQHYTENYYDIFLNVSEFEGIPIGMMEALSFGIPVIGTKTGGVSEIIAHEHNGYLLHRNPLPKEIANKLVAYYHLPETQKTEYRNNARRVWNEKFNADKNYSAFIKDIFALQDN